VHGDTQSSELGSTAGQGASGPASASPAPLVVTWLGHATALLELDGVRIMTDPVLRDRIGPLVRFAPSVGPELGAPIDAVLLSHMHADHADVRSLRMVGEHARIIAPAGAAGWLRRRGLRDVDELTPGQETSIGGVRVSATPASHQARRWPFGVQADPVGFIARGSQACYFAGDTDLFAEMSLMAGSIDLALLPIAGWGRKVGPGHLDAERSATALVRIAPRVAVPIHWGTLALGSPARRPADPGRPARRFAELAARMAPSVDVRVLMPGERTEVHSSRAAEPRSGSAMSREIRS
jgi:L-ascorbate metabolism protein UlaG (beta-lactamase superfamily)